MRRKRKDRKRDISNEKPTESNLIDAVELSNLQEKYDLELTNKDDIIADLQNRLDTALRNDDFREKYVHLETENEKLKNQLREQEDINKKPVEVPKNIDNSRDEKDLTMEQQCESLT